MRILFLILASSMFSIYGFCDLSTNPKNWYPVTDNVMGGISDLQVTYNDGVFLMQGTVSTKNNGGFVRFGQDVSFKGMMLSTVSAVSVPKEVTLP